MTIAIVVAIAVAVVMIKVVLIVVETDLEQGKGRSSTEISTWSLENKFYTWIQKHIFIAIVSFLKTKPHKSRDSKAEISED